MAGETQAMLDRIWTPEGFPRRGPLATFYRSTLIIGAAAAVFAVALPLSLLGRVFLHWPARQITAVIMAGVAINLTAQLSRVWYLFRSGGWTARDGQTFRRKEQPGRFWRAAIVQVIVLLVWLAVNAATLLVLLSA